MSQGSDCEVAVVPAKGCLGFFVFCFVLALLVVETGVGFLFGGFASEVLLAPKVGCLPQKSFRSESIRNVDFSYKQE